MKKLLMPIAVALVVACQAPGAAAQSRYFYSGDGKISISSSKSGLTFSGKYRNDDGTYDIAAMKRINALFQAKYGDPLSSVSPRLIEFIDFLQDEFGAQSSAVIISGFRSPEYNMNLRKKGKLAAKASFHQYGMAADISMKGVRPDAIWNFVKDLQFGGVGFYHGSNVHVDVGPARFWDETTSGVDSGKSDDNKLIGIIQDEDIYHPGEAVSMRIVRATLLPVGVRPTMKFMRKEKSGEWREAGKFTPTLAGSPAPSDAQCRMLSNLRDTVDIKWNLPSNIESGRYEIEASFCGDMSPGMPLSVLTPEFEIAP
jgi:uncharacterized protein YcbK (DUF882 family)